MRIDSKLKGFILKVNIMRSRSTVSKNINESVIFVFNVFHRRYYIILEI